MNVSPKNFDFENQLPILDDKELLNEYKIKNVVKPALGALKMQNDRTNSSVEDVRKESQENGKQITILQHQVKTLQKSNKKNKAELAEQKAKNDFLIQQLQETQRQISIPQDEQIVIMPVTYRFTDKEKDELKEAILPFESKKISKRIAFGNEYRKAISGIEQNEKEIKELKTRNGLLGGFLGPGGGALTGAMIGIPGGPIGMAIGGGAGAGIGAIVAAVVTIPVTIDQISCTDHYLRWKDNKKNKKIFEQFKTFVKSDPVLSTYLGENGNFLNDPVIGPDGKLHERDELLEELRQKNPKFEFVEDDLIPCPHRQTLIANRVKEILDATVEQIIETKYAKVKDGLKAWMLDYERSKMITLENLQLHTGKLYINRKISNYDQFIIHAQKEWDLGLTAEDCTKNYLEFRKSILKIKNIKEKILKAHVNEIIFSFRDHLERKK